MAPHNVAAPNMLPASELMLPTAYTKQVTRNTNNVYNLKIDCLLDKNACLQKYYQGQTNTNEKGSNTLNRTRLPLHEL